MTHKIRVPGLARVEGEGGLEIVTEHGQVTEANVRVGGFYRAPKVRDLRGLAGELEWARQAALDTVRRAAARPAARSAGLAVRAGGPQPRPVHLLFGPLPGPAGPGPDRKRFRR